MRSISGKSFEDFTQELSKECEDFGINYKRTLRTFIVNISSNKSLSFYLTNYNTVSLLSKTRNNNTDLLKFSNISSLRNYVFCWIINNN